MDEDYQKLAESNEVKIEALSAKLAELTEFLDNQKDSFFNWLSEHKPGWEQTIGQVCDERLLYGKEFTAEVGEGDTFYGIRFTSGIHRNVKTKEDYLAEKKDAEEKTCRNPALHRYGAAGFGGGKGESPQAISILREAHQGGYLSCGI